MANPRLVVDEASRDKWRLTWYMPDEDEKGGSVGDGLIDYSNLTANQVDALKGDEWEVAVAHRAAATTEEAQRDNMGFYWPNQSRARAALRVVKLALKATPERPMPEWAKLATAAGWKPPKGWKP